MAAVNCSTTGDWRGQAEAAPEAVRASGARRRLGMAEGEGGTDVLYVEGEDSKVVLHAAREAGDGGQHMEG